MAVGSGVMCLCRTMAALGAYVTCNEAIPSWPSPCLTIMLVIRGSQQFWQGSPYRNAFTMEPRCRREILLCRWQVATSHFDAFSFIGRLRMNSIPCEKGIHGPTNKASVSADSNLSQLALSQMVR